MSMLPNSRLVAELQRRTVAGFYGDTATVLQDTVTSLDSYGQPVVTTSSTSVTCSFTDKPDKENWKDFADISQVSAEIRFVSPAPAHGNRVTLTGRFGDSTYTDATFEIIGIQDRGAFGYVCALKKVSL